MRTHLWSRAAAFAIALLALPAQAELVEVDLTAPGDGLVTRDTETGLDWLDLGGVTTNLSYDQIQGGAGGWLASGWRYATQAEVCALFVAHGSVPTCNFNSGLLTGEFYLQTGFIDLLGSTGTTLIPDLTIFVAGLYDDGTGAPAGEARVTIATTFPPSPFYVRVTQATPDAVPSSTASPTRGSFLVRATPPVVPALPPACVAALAVLLGLAARRSSMRR